MTANGKEILRWTAIAVFGGLAVWLLSYSDYYVIKYSDGDWFGSFFLLGFTGLCAVPFVAVAYICYHRQYRELFNVLGAVGAIVVFGVLISLPNHWHVDEFWIRRVDQSPWLAFLAFPVSLLCLFVPFYGATWFYRYGHRLALPPTLPSSEPPIFSVERSG
jgi:hypothetical protein